MTKDVELHSGTWKKMNSALTGLTENSSVSSSGYGSYTNAQAGPYSMGASSTGFAKRIEELVEISERAKRLINEKDTDGVVSFRYHDESSNAQTLQSKLGALEKYSANVSKYLKEKIDQPFYEAMDKVGAKLEALSIQNYKTTNTVGYKRTDVIRDEYGNKVGTMEVTPKEIGVDELYKVESPYKAALQKSYEEFKKSKEYKDHRLTETEYVQAMHQTRAFEYVSIDDEKSKIEMWRDIALGAGLVVLSIFCPPAGAVAGVALASAEMYSAATGKDWGTGRKLDATERTLRGTFALFDLIPAGKYLGTLAKTGKTAGLTAVKNSLKTTLKEGLEQGAKNLDSFKGVLKNAKGLGDNVLSQIKTYGKQLDNLRPSKILSNSADALSDGLRHADTVLSEAAQNFRLNIGLEPQLADGVLSSSGGKLSHLADNLSAFAKNLDGSVDDVVEANRFSSEWHNLQKSFPDSGLSERQSEKIVNIKPSETIKRPDPEEYLSSNYIKEHNALFDKGVAAFAKNDYWIQKEGYFGRPDGAFVFPKDVAEAMVKEADGDPHVLEKLLGLDKGSLGNNPIMIEPKEVENLRIPSGNEGGASGNVQWRPGGKTYPGGVPESVIDRVPKDKLHIKELWSE